MRAIDPLDECKRFYSHDDQSTQPANRKAQSPWVLSEKNANAVRGETRVRLVIGEQDEMLQVTREFNAHLTRLKIPHKFTVLPRVGHKPMELLNAIEDDNRQFYRAVFSDVSPSHDRENQRPAQQDTDAPRSAESVKDPSALAVTFLGTGGPRPSMERYGPSFLVEAGDHRILIDAGSGLKERLLQAGSFELITGLNHVLITHLHYDHTVELSDLWLTGWLFGRRVPLRIQGPPGTTAMMEDIERAFKWDVNYRITVGVPAAGSQIEALDVSPGVIFDQDGLMITAFEVEHMPIDLTSRERIDFEGQTYGYRIDYEGHSVVFSGDTRPSDNLVTHAQGADVLIHEVQVPSPGASKEARLANVSLSVHSTPDQAGAIFARVNPRMAVYSHIIPPQVTSEELIAATPYDGPVTVAHDLMMIILGDQLEVVERREVGMESFEGSRVLR